MIATKYSTEQQISGPKRNRREISVSKHSGRVSIHMCEIRQSRQLSLNSNSPGFPIPKIFDTNQCYCLAGSRQAALQCNLKKQDRTHSLVLPRWSCLIRSPSNSKSTALTTMLLDNPRSTRVSGRALSGPHDRIRKGEGKRKETKVTETL